MPELDAETVARQLLVVLDEALLGASGPSTYFVANRPDSGFLGALAQVDTETASRVIGGRSIAAHANHVAFAMEASAAWIAGDRAPRDWNVSWEVVGSVAHIAYHLGSVWQKLAVAHAPGPSNG